MLLNYLQLPALESCDSGWAQLEPFKGKKEWSFGAAQSCPEEGHAHLLILPQNSHITSGTSLTLPTVQPLTQSPRGGS